MPILVQKFGGTSVNTAEKREKVLQKVIKAREAGYDVVVVVSAMGRKGEPYATDTLLDLLSQISPTPQARNKDLLSACGEIITTCIVAQALEEKGQPAQAMTGFQAGVTTDDNYTNSEIRTINPERIHKALKQGKVVVVAGFQGCTEEMDVTTLGRGGSDTSAIALGGALGADLTEIYTDVPGIAFTDPRIWSEAPYLQSIDFNTMYLLARAGAKVIHPRAVKTAITYNSPFYVRSTFSEEKGTLIGKQGESFGGIYGIALLKDIAISRMAGPDSTGMGWKMALDEMFYQVDAHNCCFAMQGNTAQAGNSSSTQIKEGLDLLTVPWDSGSGMSLQILQGIIKEAGVHPEATFTMGSAVSWAVPQEDTLKVVHALAAVARTSRTGKAV